MKRLSLTLQSGGTLKLDTSKIRQAYTSTGGSTITTRDGKNRYAVTDSINTIALGEGLVKVTLSATHTEVVINELDFEQIQAVAGSGSLITFIEGISPMLVDESPTDISEGVACCIVCADPVITAEITAYNPAAIEPIGYAITPTTGDQYTIDLDFTGMTGGELPDDMTILVMDSGLWNIYDKYVVDAGETDYSFNTNPNIPAAFHTLVFIMGDYVHISIGVLSGTGTFNIAQKGTLSVSTTDVVGTVPAVIFQLETSGFGSGVNKGEFYQLVIENNAPKSIGLLGGTYNNWKYYDVAGLNTAAINMKIDFGGYLCPQQSYDIAVNFSGSTATVTKV